MSNTAERYKSVTNLLIPLSAVLGYVLAIVVWLTGFFTVSGEDLMAAGVFVDGERRED